MKLTAAHRSTLHQSSNLSVLIGFDGFRDSIYRLVKKRKNAVDYECMKKMHEFSDRIIQAHGKSTNIELVLEQERIGGNGPILAASLVALGVDVALIGALGYPEIDPLFLPLAKKCTECITIAPSGQTDAFEFSDGKLLLGKHSSILTLDEKTILNRVGKGHLCRLLKEARIFASANWTMLFGLTAFWNYLAEELLPTLTKKPEWMFVDIADPAKRHVEDLLDAMHSLTRLQRQLKVVLGLNVREAEQVAKVLKAKPTAKSLRDALEIEQVVIHAIEEAEAASKQETKKTYGPHVAHPVLTTGGGDNFNAGYILGLLHEKSLEETLLYATHTSGYYVQHGRSPHSTSFKNFYYREH